MTRDPSVLGLGLRLAVSGGRACRLRLLLMAGAVAAGVAVLLGLAGVLPAAVAGERRAEVRTPVLDDAAGRSARSMLAGGTEDRWRGRPLRVLRLANVDAGDQPPPGIASVPRVGQAYVSPALAAALRGPDGSELAARLPRIVGVIQPAGLRGPRELYAIAGASPADLPADLPPVRALRGGAGTDWGSVDDEVQLAPVLGGVVLIVPVLVLVATAARLSAAERGRRLAALRLVGVTGRQARMLAAMESGLAGSLGALVGGVAFLMLRGPVAGLLPVADGVYPGDIEPPLRGAVVILLGMPLLTTLSGAAGLRPVRTSPLAVSRRARTVSAGWSRLAPLLLGVAALMVAAARGDALEAGSRPDRALLLGGIALVLLGVAVAAPTLTRAGGILVGRLGRGLAAELAAARLRMDTGTASRAVTGVALVVVVAGGVLALLPGHSVSRVGGLPAGVGAAVDSGTLVGVRRFWLPPQPPDLRRLRATPGVLGAADLRTVTLARGTVAVTAVVGDCAELTSVLPRAPDCVPGRIYRLGSDPVTTGRFSVRDGADRRLPGSVRVPAAVPALDLPAALAVDGWQLWLPRAAVPDLRSTRGLALVRTDGGTAAVEAARSVLGAAWSPLQVPTTPAEDDALTRAATAGYARVALAGLLAALLVGGMSLAVATVDALAERRHALAALTAIGAARTLLLRSILLSTAAALLPTVAVATVASAVCSWLLRPLLDPGATAPLPWGTYGLIGAVAVTAVTLATSATLPFLRTTNHPAALRTG